MRKESQETEHEIVSLRQEILGNMPGGDVDENTQNLFLLLIAPLVTVSQDRDKCLQNFSPVRCHYPVR